MPATKVLEYGMIFNDVPVLSTKRGFAIPRPAVLRTLALTGKEDSHDKEWDGRSAPFSWNKQTQTRYLAVMQYKAMGKAGFTKTIVSVKEVDTADWNDAVRAWRQYLVDNAENYTSTHATVTRGLGSMRPRTLTGGNAPAPSVPIHGSITPVPTVQNNGPMLMKTWDPNDLDIAHDLYDVPADNPNFLIDRETDQILTAEWQIANLNDEPRTVLIMGDTSTGKTETPIIWAARNDVLHCRIDCGAFGEIYDVTGPIKAKEQNGVSVTEWIKGKTIRAMADPRPAIIQLDEVNRISDVKAMNILFPFFDSARQSYFDDNQTWMKLNGVKLIVATMNGDTRGDDIGEYVGTQPLDQAFISRFPVRRQLRYPNAEKLALILEARNGGVIPAATIQTVAEIANELVALNKFVPNLRELFAAMDFLKHGHDIFHALKWTVGGVYKDDGTIACDYISFKSVLNGKGIKTDETP
jgi:hypothetical protein